MLDLITPKRKPIAVKIDTQGAEPFVIAGGAKLLANASLLIMEIWPYGITRLGGSIEAIVSLLRDNFETVHLPVDGSGELPGRREPMSSQVASARLIQMMGQKGDPSFYLDVVASNTVRDAIPQA